MFLLTQVGCVGERCEDYIRQNDINAQFSGVIKECYFDENDRGTPTFILGSGTIIKCDAHSLCCNANTGDSIWKHYGSLKYYLKVGDTFKVFYPECGNVQIRDTGTFTTVNFISDCGKRKQTKKLPIRF